MRKQQNKAEVNKDRPNLDKRLYNFALRIISIVRRLPKEVAGYEIGKQLVRAGTSILANYEEARETTVWLKLLKDSGIIKGIEIDDQFRN